MNENHSSSSSPPPSVISSSPNSEESKIPNWLDLPRDITSMILQKLGPIVILNNAQRVCTQWRSITKDPLMWRVFDTSNSFDNTCMEIDFEELCRHAIVRSQGYLVDITLDYFGSDDLLHYIADSTTHLQRLRLVSCWEISDKGMSEVAKKLALLEDLDITFGNLSNFALEAIGQCCPRLTSLKFNIHQAYKGPNDEEAFAIAKNMPNLCHLQLYGNNLTDDGVLAILDGCPHLESLDLRQCFNVNLGGSLAKRCAEQIKDFRHPNAPTDDYAFDSGSDYHDDSFRFDDYYSYGNSFDTMTFWGDNNTEDDIDEDEQNAWLLDLGSYPYL